MLANAVASIPGISFFRCSAASLTSKWRGESEKLVRSLFKVKNVPGSLLLCLKQEIVCKVGEELVLQGHVPFQVALERAPSVLFFDEADALCSQRGRPDEHEASRRFKAELLQQIDALWNETKTTSIRSFDSAIPPSQSVSRTSRVVVIAATNAPWCINWGFVRRVTTRVPDIIRPSEEELVVDVDLGASQK